MTQRILADINNTLPAATFTASSVLPAYRNTFRQQTTRSGNGEIVLKGGYVGEEDAVFEIEIRESNGTIARVTQPIFSGAGNGTMTQPTAADGTAGQALAVTLVDLGVETQYAQAILYANVLLQAVSAGTAGNAITLNLTAGIALSEAVGVLSDDLARGTQEWTDQKIDFGAKPLNPDGTIPDSAPRIVFGRDPSMVYRHYKRWDGDQWQYGVSPKLAASYKTGADVHTVIGDYSATVSDGVATETYPGLTTLYSLLLALGSSALITVETPPANDRKPSGMAAIDIPFRTAAFSLPVEKSRADLADLVGITVTATAPTESVVVECVDDTSVNSEIWAVRSKVAGTLVQAVTGTAYTAGFVGFTIPSVSLDSSPVAGHIGISERSFPRDDATVTIPDVCLYKPFLGSAARDMTLRLVWTKRPDGTCSCKDTPVSGRPREDFLGIDLGDEAMAALLPGHRARLEALTAWHHSFVAANTEVTATGEVRTAQTDVQLAGIIANELNECLSDLYTCADAVIVEDGWSATTEYETDYIVSPVPQNNYRYRCTSAGTSAASPPVWPTTVGTTVTDGGIVWKCISLTAPKAWDAMLAGLDSDLAALKSLSAVIVPTFAALAVSTAYTVNTVAQYNASSGTSYLLCVKAGTTGSSFSTVNTAIGASTSQGTAVFRVVTLAEAYAFSAGGSADISYDTGGIARPGMSYSVDDFAQRYAAACDEVRAIAGVLPKKSDASAAGSGVWQDLETDYWAIAGTDYLPVFSNTYYHACRRAVDEDGNPVIVPTFEFGFAVRVGCPESLVYGDSITITIGDVSVSRPYKEGDTYTIPVVAGGPLGFSGGIDGDDTLMWVVKSSTAGALADYPLGADEAAYSDSGIGFTIQRGGIPFALGDTFRFAVETGGQLRWRKDDAAWSADIALGASIVLSDGMTAYFTEGAAPSFVVGDLHRFRVKQPNSPLHALSADDAGWKWAGDTATLRLDFDADQQIEAIGILRHTLTSAASLSIELRDAADSGLGGMSGPGAPGPILEFFDIPFPGVRSVLISVSNATGMSLGWVYAGVPWKSTNPADEYTLRRIYALDRSTGVNPSSAYLGCGRDGELSWKNWFMSDDLTALLALLDDVKSRGDLPVVVVPNEDDVDDAALVRIGTDTLEITDEYRFQDPTMRRMSVTLPLTAVVS